MMDGNDSLKCILWWAPVDDPVEGEAKPDGPWVVEFRELPDSREVGGDYLISREWVNKWAKDILKEALPAPELVCV